MAREGTGLSLLHGSFWFFAYAICRLLWYCTTGCLAILRFPLAVAEKSDPLQLWGTWYSCHIQLLLTWWYAHCLSQWWIVLSVAAPPRVPTVIRWLRWVLTCCFPWRHESCCDEVFCAKVAWGKTTVCWPELWIQRKLCTFGAYTCFPLVKMHRPIKQRHFSAVFFPVGHTPTEVNRSFTCSTGTENVYRVTPAGNKQLKLLGWPVKLWLLSDIFFPTLPELTMVW